MDSKLVAVGPIQDFFPYVPNILIVQDSDDEYRLIKRDCDIKMNSSSFLESTKLEDVHILSKQVSYRENHWVAIAKNGVYWLKPGMEMGWRQSQAKIFKDMSEKTTDPMDKISYLLVSGHMMQVNLLDFNRKIQQRRINGESIDDVFARLKKSEIKDMARTN
jgi:hypothetical protein